MKIYFAGYKDNVPVVYCDNGDGIIYVSHNKRRTIQAAHNLAKIWNGHERKKAKKSPSITLEDFKPKRI